MVAHSLVGIEAGLRPQYMSVVGVGKACGGASVKTTLDLNAAEVRCQGASCPETHLRKYTHLQYYPPVTRLAGLRPIFCVVVFVLKV